MKAELNEEIWERTSAHSYIIISENKRKLPFWDRLSKCNMQHQPKKALAETASC